MMTVHNYMVRVHITQNKSPAETSQEQQVSVNQTFCEGKA